MNELRTGATARAEIQGGGSLMSYVLIVEDDHDLPEMRAFLLGCPSYAARTAANGREALGGSARRGRRWSFSTTTCRS
jgi:hypothetical protein